jgi:hypothetical protein
MGLIDIEPMTGIGMEGILSVTITSQCYHVERPPSFLLQCKTPNVTDIFELTAETLSLCAAEMAL